MNQNHLEASIKRVPRETILLGVIFSITCGIIFEPVCGILVFLGALLSAIGFIALNSFINRYLGKKKTMFLRRAILMYSLRLLLICLVFLIIIFFFKGKIIAFVAGFSLIVVSVLVEALRNLAYVKQWKV
ncbi:MAG: ATP synthase subunit I [Candidatus Aminicenantes bacterium]|nr:ATP synthase subunit I [Candidatus Aminicenantes bacterium]